mgnify:FL=1
MYCPKCGNKLQDNQCFCNNCGYKLENNNIDIINENNSNFTEEINQKIFKATTSVKSIISKYKKQLTFGSGILICLVFIYVVYGLLFGYTKLKWNDEYKDLSLDLVTQSNVKLGFLFDDDKNLNKLKIESTCGDYELKNKEISWNLTDSLGKCSVNISYKLRKITKKYNVVDPYAEDHELYLDADEIKYEDGIDSDEDGLSNILEKELGTNPLLSDSDMDGLSDYDETNVYKTDPLQADTDGDGVSDYDEIQLGLDPLKECSFADNVKDGERTLSYNLTEKNVKMSLTGKKNIANTSVTVYKTNAFEKLAVLNNVYNFYTEGVLDEAIVEIPYDLASLEEKNISEDELALFYFNDETKKLELVSSSVDKEKKVVKATLKHFSKYVLGNKNLNQVNNDTNIMFAIDNSISMYTTEQMTEAGYSLSTGAIGNDKNFKRLTLTNKMIGMFNGGYKFSVAEFSGNFVQINTFTTASDVAIDAVNSMKSYWHSNSQGTDIITALNSGISKFTKVDDNNYLIILTDGRNTEGSLDSDKEDILKKAKKSNVKVCAIGLGDSIDTDALEYIANNSGCAYYNATDDKALDEIYAIVGKNINYNLEDVDGDGTIDGTNIADSGFVVSRDGFSFRNYGTNLSEDGHCYGMATVAELYYTKKLPLQMEAKTINHLEEDYNVYGYDLSKTYFKNYNNLYDYKLKTNILKYTFGYETFDEEQPSDLFSLSGDTLGYSETYKNELNDSKLYDFITYKSTLDKKTQLERWGVNYTNAEKVLLNEDKMQSSNVINNQDKQILNAIYSSFVKQFETKFYSSSSDFVSWLGNVLKVQTTVKLNSNAFIEMLKERLNDGDAPVIASNFNGGGHAINAISLVQDIDDANHYYIGVYDNNAPGEKRYVDIKCNKNSCVTMANKYYSKSNQPIKINFSLEDDLKYFEN